MIVGILDVPDNIKASLIASITIQANQCIFCVARDSYSSHLDICKKSEF